MHLQECFLYWKIGNYHVKSVNWTGLQDGKLYSVINQEYDIWYPSIDKIICKNDLE